VSRSGPLSGIRVLELSRLLPGAYATLLMGDLGADVIKVEERGRGDYMRWVGPMSDEDTSAIFSASCRNKRSITVDLKTAEGTEIVRDLAATSQVVVEGFRPGVAARLGVGYDDLRAVNPKIVYCSISGYGQNGPMADRPGHDLNYLAAAGVLDTTGDPDGPPAMPGVQIADVWGGGLTAAYAVMAALVGGESAYLDIGMYDGSAAVLTNHAAAWLAGGLRFDRGNMLLSGGVPNYAVWQASDGWVTLACTEVKFWQRACELLEVPKLAAAFGAQGEQAVNAREKLRALFLTRTRSEWDELLGGPETCFAPVLTVEEALEDEHMQARGLVTEVQVNGRAERQMATAVDRMGSGGHVRAPRIGEHTEAILAELGRDGDEIARLREAGAV
jgi:alpha-methylacyl-CoA racemase